MNSSPSLGQYSLSRRGILGGAVAGLGVLAVQSLESRVNAATLQGSMPRKVDAVVVGAGIAGLVAARNIARAGRSVVLVEARGRVGGRVLNHHLATGGTIESGGAFVGPTQGHIQALADEYGIETFPEYVDGKNVYISSTTGRQEYSGTVPPDPTILPDAAILLERLNQMAAATPVDAPWAHPKAAHWDSLTLEDWIRRNALNGEGVTNLIRSWTEPGFGADPSELPLLHVVHYIACSGDETHVGTFERNSDTAGGAQERRFVGGSQRVPLAIAEELGDVVALNAAVDRIEQHDRGAVVHTARGPINCQRVIVATPPSHVLDVDWDPVLPQGRRQLLSRVEMGRLMKCDAVYETPFWREDGLSGFGISDSGAVRVAFDNHASDTDHGILLAFVGGATWDQYGTEAISRDARRRAVLEGFAAMFGERALHPIEYAEYDWTQEQWTRGGPVGNFTLGALSSLGQHLRARFGRVHWAGTETSTYWTGYMDGAARSGERAAIEVLDWM